MTSIHQNLSLVYIALIILLLILSGIQLYRFKMALGIDVFPEMDILPDKKIEQVLDALHF